MVKLVLKKREDHQLPSQDVLPGRFRSAVGKKRTPRRLKFIPIILLILFAIVVVQTGRAYIEFSRVLDERHLETRFSDEGYRLVGSVYSSLDVDGLIPTADVNEFIRQAQSRLNSGEADAPISAKAFELGNLLHISSRTKENYRVRLQSTLANPPTVMERHSPSKEDAERQRRAKFFAQNAAIKPWQDYVTKTEPRALSLLASIQRMELSFVNPVTGYDRLVAFARYYWRNNKQIVIVKKYIGVNEKDVNIPKILCQQCRGQGVVSCPGCLGRGSVNYTVVSPCDQCKGTGHYQRKLSKSSTECPFCRGKGQISRSASKTCATCDGLGRVPCSSCLQVAQ